MAVMRQGRGAWPSDGRGGTLSNPTTPGKYYMLGEGWNTVGIHAVLRFLDGQSNIPFDEIAVHNGVKGIQSLLNACDGIKNKVTVDGVFGKQTDTAVRELQKIGSLPINGVVGPATMKTLMLLPIVKDSATKNISWEAVYGLLAFEGGWDPGAVGYVDSNDLGLAQVNTKAHPTVTVTRAYDPFWAIGFIENYLINARTYLGNNIRDMVASYNLGIGGARQWIAAGRPDVVWQPSWSTTPRKPNEYIDKILNAHKA